MKIKFIVIILLLSFLSLMGLIRSDKKISKAGEIKVELRSFNIEVNAIGELDAADAHMVSSTLQGTAGKIIELIEDGVQVKKGDLLAKLDKTPYEEDLQLLAGEIKKYRAAESAKIQLFEWEKSQLEKELKTADYHIEKAEIEFSKYINGEGPLMLVQMKEEVDKAQLMKSKIQNYLDDLFRLEKEGFDYPSEIYKAKQDIAAIEDKLKGAQRKFNSYKEHIYPSLSREHQANIEHARMQKEQIEKAGGHKLAQARSGLDEVRATIDNLSTKLEKTKDQIKKTRIYAPSGGIVILYETYRDGQKRKPRVGDNVLRTQPILYLPDISSMVVKTKIREVDLHKVQTGQGCSVFVDAYPDKKLEGRVLFIGALASDQLGGNPGVKYFRMIVEIITPDPQLRPGMTSRVNIVTKTIADQLCIPLYCVFEDNKGAFCYQSSTGGLKKVRIETGDSNESFMVVRSGLKKGDVISPVSLTSKQQN